MLCVRCCLFSKEGVTTAKYTNNLKRSTVNGVQNAQSKKFEQYKFCVYKNTTVKYQMFLEYDKLKRKTVKGEGCLLFKYNKLYPDK